MMLRKGGGRVPRLRLGDPCHKYKFAASHNLAIEPYRELFVALSDLVDGIVDRISCVAIGGIAFAYFQATQHH